MKSGQMSVEDAVRFFQSSPEFADLVRDAYFDDDVRLAARRFAESGEFLETLRWASLSARGDVLDLGAGRGIASYAFAHAGARRVFALEPDPSDVVGLGALQIVIGDSPIAPFAAFAEAIPLPDESCDLVYARQVLHHIPNLPAAMREVARVLRSGGLFMACREHVVDDAGQLQAFLSAHPVHQRAGGENAYRLDQYLSAINQAGLLLREVIRPLDSVITLFPAVQSQDNLDSWFVQSRGPLGQAVLRVGASIPGVIPAVRHWRGDTHLPGRLYAFVATKP